MGGVKLKPCPFCGGEAKITQACVMQPLFCVHCVDCDTSGGHYFTEEDAIEAWNTRVERTCHNDLKDSDCVGVWPKPHFKCSSCGTLFTSYEFDYCPSCGAKVVNE